MNNCYNCKHYVEAHKTTQIYNGYFAVLSFDVRRVNWCLDAKKEIPYENVKMDGCCGFCKKE